MSVADSTYAESMRVIHLDRLFTLTGILAMKIRMSYMCHINHTQAHKDGVSIEILIDMFKHTVGLLIGEPLFVLYSIRDLARK